MIVRLFSLLAVFLPLSLAAQAPESVMVVEAYSGKILVASNAGQKRPVASLNKIATAVVAIDWATASDRDIATVMITAPQTVSLVGGPNPMNLQPGDRLSLRDALYSALLGSDNLAALTIADHVGRDLLARRGRGGDPVAAFVAEMGRLGQAVGMTQTNFVNPHGLDIRNTKGYSTAADMAKLSVYAMRRNAFNFIVRQPNRNVTVSGAGGNRKFLVRNTNQLVGEPGILGIKTGTTNAAGQCLAVCMDREPLVRMKADGNKGATPRRLIVIILNNPQRFDRARSLIRQGWSIYDPWLAAGAPVNDPKREILAIPPAQ
ncbi:MAG: D-alanyl-D-alanine carboxypeptidase [Akkermansiaceae bacterium]|nr:D-alanyl-D-alanine carboxypeptidase [Akkermansiaceae bacterium]